MEKEKKGVVNKSVPKPYKFQMFFKENVHRFLLTTTTGSFHIIDLFHGLDQPDRLATRPLDVGGPGGGIGHRMSLLLFGSLTAEKERF